MGILASRQNAGVEEVDINTNHAYRYPPKSGNYFGTHFIMGGERFDTPQPEAYLFGENGDLNFLGNKPTPFPYPAPQANEPTKTLKSLINIRKESLRFVRASEEIDNDKNLKAVGDRQIEKPSTKYNIEFTFDSDVRCSITVYYFATEEITPNGLIYTPRDSSMNSETYQYKKGANQQFCQINHWLDPALYSEDELNYSLEKEIMPIVIHCVAEEGEGNEPKQSHVTMAVVEKNSDSTYTLKPLKQKQFVDGLCYLLQEIYGIENKNAEYCKNSNDDEVEDNGSECVICMCDIRDTLILPCRHLCLCNSCADSLRYQANNCPICRAPFRALLQIRALRKASTAAPGSLNTHMQENIPQGFEAVSLIEALNGPANPLPAIPVTIPVSNTPALALSQPIAVVGSQDAMTSPTMKFPNETCGRRLFGSSASLRCHVTTEDSSAQTDCPMIPLTVMTDRRTSTPDVSLSMILPGVDTDSLKGQQNLIQIINEVQLPKIKEGSISPQLTEAQSLLEVGAAISRLIKSDSKIISRSTPDSLHLCERKNLSDYVDERVTSGGDDSDYYTPEDPGTTLLSEQFHKESQVNQGAEREMKPKLNPPSFIECVSLPGTPQSQASNRSSGDSFSSTSSTRLLLPHQSQEILSEDKATQ